MQSIEYTEKTALEDMEKSIKIVWKDVILPSKHFKDCGEVELSDKTIADYLGFCTVFLLVLCT